MMLPRGMSRARHDDRARAARPETRRRPRSDPPRKPPARRRPPTRRASRRRGGAASRGGGAGARPARDRRRARRARRSRAGPPPAAGPRSPNPTDPGPCRSVPPCSLDGVACDRPDRDRGAPARSAGGTSTSGPHQTGPAVEYRRPRRAAAHAARHGHRARPCSTAFATRLSSAWASRIGISAARAPRRRASRARPAGAPSGIDTFQASTTRRRDLLGGPPTRGARTDRTGKRAARRLEVLVATNSARSYPWRSASKRDRSDDVRRPLEPGQRRADRGQRAAQLVGAQGHAHAGGRSGDGS